MAQAIQRVGNLVIFGGSDWKDSKGDALQTIIIPYDDLGVEITDGAINWYYYGASFLTTFADIPTADFSSVADKDSGGAWKSNPVKIQILLSESYKGNKSSNGNYLLIMRKYLVGDEVQVLFEPVIEQTEVLADCFAIRFINAGKNTVMVDKVPLDTNECLDIPGEANFSISTKFKIYFDDGTTGRTIIKKNITAETLAGL